MKNTFDQSKDCSQITFKRVRELYGDNPLYIVQTFRLGWTEVKMDATMDNVHYYAMLGVTKFQFIVENQFGEICYPDYSLDELIRQ